MNLPEKRNTHGQILLSLLISLALFSILAHALFTLVTSSYSLMSFIKTRRIAKNLAQQRIEIIRNMAYDDIGTMGGIPAGILSQTEIINIDGINFTVQTSVIYVDDPFDQQAPNDLLAADYKNARIDVSWEGLSASRGNPITLVTNIAPRGIESTTGGGTLSIIVFDSLAQPVGQADVTIVASSLNPQINLNLKTSSDGRLFLPGAPPCSNACYQITVSKDGYSTERTYSISEVANPNKPNLNVTIGGLTEMSFAIDKTSTIHMASFKDRYNEFEVLPNVAFYIRGDKTIGTDDDDQPVYKYNTNFTTNESGILDISSLEWDNYTIVVDPVAGWNISGTNPFMPIILIADQSVDLKMALTATTANSVLVAFMNSDEEPLASVSAVLSNTSGYESATISGKLGDPDYGEIYFASLGREIYQLSATASGFATFSANIDVAGYKTEKVIMSPE